MAHILHSIGKAKAIALAESGWWKERPAREVVGFQLFTTELSMDFGEFHRLTEEALGRPVWTHEFARIGDLQKEFLGEKPAPSFEDIINLIPAEKHIVLAVEEQK